MLSSFCASPYTPSDLPSIGSLVQVSRFGDGNRFAKFGALKSVSTASKVREIRRFEKVREGREYESQKS
jgi:hypothetical protein